MSLVQKIWTGRILFAVLAGMLTIVQANFVGDVTIYSLDAASAREISHERLVHNAPPEGGWNSTGLNGANIRIAIPYLVEFLHGATGIRVLQLYKGLDLTFLWLSFIVFFLFLRGWFSPLESLLACIYFAAMLPLTFAFHSYHPWDRASLLAWLAAIWAARMAHFWVFLAVSVTAVLIKYDAVVLPALYFLANVTRQNRQKILFQSVMAGAILLALFGMLIVLLPNGFEPKSNLDLILRNLGNFGRNPFMYAPSLAFGLPIALAILGYRSCDRFMRASLWFACLITVPLFIATNFEEVRAEQMLFPLLAPAALVGLRRLTDEPSVIKLGSRSGAGHATTSQG